MGSIKVFEPEQVLPVIQKLTTGIKPKRIEAGETIEVRIGIKGYDSARETRFRGDVTLPFPKRGNEKVLVIAEASLAKVLENTDIPFVLMENYKGKDRENKLKRKKLIKQYHSFISLPSVYKVFEPSLFTGNKKPVYMIKNVNEIKNYYEDVKRKVPLNLRADMLFGFPIGTSKMPAENVAQNFSAAMTALLGLVKKGMQNIRSVHIKTTQGAVVKYY